MTEAMSCSVCMEVYDQVLRTPLILPCGHTFCRPCLANIGRFEQFTCPSCRAQHNVPVGALAVNHSLLNITPLCSDLEFEKCITHKDSLRYWCSTCDLPLCSLCLHSKHPQDHNIKLTKTLVQEKKLKLEEEIKTKLSTIKNQTTELKSDFNDLDAWMKELFGRNAKLQNLARYLNDLLAKIQKTYDMTSVKSLEKRVNEFYLLLKEFTKLSSNDCEPMTGIMKDTLEDVAEPVNPITPLVQQQGSSAPSQHKRETTNVGGAVMDFRCGRLLLHSLAEPESTRLSFQMPSEVFLELSVGERRLGIVYISLWTHMRLSQQFLALCMGTMGQSLLGIKAYIKIRGIIVFRFGVTEDHNPFLPAGKKNPSLLTNLEWGGQHVMREADGYVMGIDENKGMAFGICTKKHQNSTLSAPFGAVSTGLDVAREAFNHNPVTEVTITRCGLVLQGFTAPEQPSDLSESSSSALSPESKSAALQGFTTPGQPSDLSESSSSALSPESKSAAQMLFACRRGPRNAHFRRRGFQYARFRGRGSSLWWV